MNAASKSPSVDLYFSFRSPYSYLLAPRLLDMYHDWEMELRLRIVLPIAVRMPDFFQTVNPLMPPYLMRDTARLAERYEMPYAWPRPDPVAFDRAANRAEDQQPRIHRLSRIGVLADEARRGIELATEFSRVIFGGTKDWDQGDHLALAAERAGCDLAEMDRQQQEETARLDRIIATNQQAQTKAGHWGVPLMVCDGEPFFGQDRLDLLFWRLKQKGLRQRV